MKPYQQRVVAERADLHEKIKRLGDFLGGNAELSVAERSRLLRQHGWMCGYLAVLGERIAAFEGC